MEAEVEAKTASLPVVSYDSALRLLAEDSKNGGIKGKTKRLQSAAPVRNTALRLRLKFDHSVMMSCLCHTQSSHLHNHIAKSFLHSPHVTKNEGEKQSREHQTGFDGNLRSGDGETTPLSWASICSAGQHRPSIWRALAAHVCLSWGGGGPSPGTDSVNMAVVTHGLPPRPSSPLKGTRQRRCKATIDTGTVHV